GVIMLFFAAFCNTDTALPLFSFLQIRVNSNAAPQTSQKWHLLKAYHFFATVVKPFLQLF
ncbi:MAG: hypothetical protein FWG66_02990, partial [Spirochaetes bacterium]|nr:hypothetical protein [Spirochaetota bacterium]